MYVPRDAVLSQRAHCHAGPVYAMDWCKTSAPGQQLRPRSSFRLGIGSLTEDYRNHIAIVGLQDERVLVEDDYADTYPDFVTLVEANHGYPATSLQWQPASAASYNWSHQVNNTELLATTGDALRIWEYSSDQQPNASSYVGRQASGGGHRLALRAALSGVRRQTWCEIDVRLTSCPPYTAKQGSKPIKWRAIDQLLVE